MNELHELPDLEYLDDSEQTHEVYAWAGLALYYAQVLEHGIANLIFVVQGTEGTLQSQFNTVDEFYEAHFRKTLGQLKLDATRADPLVKDVEDLLAEALERRNFLAHNFFRDRADLFPHQAGRQQMLEELRDAVTLFIKADMRIEAILFARGKADGITRERVNQLVEERHQSSDQGG